MTDEWKRHPSPHKVSIGVASHYIFHCIWKASSVVIQVRVILREKYLFEISVVIVNSKYIDGIQGRVSEL